MLSTIPNLKLILIMTFLGVFVVSGCVRRNDSPRMGRVARGVGGFPIGLVDPLTGAIRSQGNCGDINLSNGKIFDNGQSVLTFQARLALLASASMDPALIGSISGNINDPTYGVDFMARLNFDESGKLNPMQSMFNMKAYDSNAYTEGGRPNPFEVGFVPNRQDYENGVGTRGTYNKSTNELNVTFEDALGTLTLIGVNNGSMVTGIVQFRNYRNWTGGGVMQTEVILGGFAIRACGLFN